MISSWDKSLETGNALIDSQHKELIKFLDELKAIDPESHDEVLRMLDQLMEFTVVHFLSEENLMRKVGFPPDPTRAMIEQHLQLKSHARLRVLEFRQGDMQSVLPLLTFLNESLRFHEFEIDRQLADWIRRYDGPFVSKSPENKRQHM